MKTVRQQASKCGGRGPVKDFLLLYVSPHLPYSLPPSIQQLQTFEGLVLLLHATMCLAKTYQRTSFGQISTESLSVLKIKFG